MISSLMKEDCKWDLWASLRKSCVRVWVTFLQNFDLLCIIKLGRNLKFSLDSWEKFDETRLPNTGNFRILLKYKILVTFMVYYYMIIKICLNTYDLDHAYFFFMDISIKNDKIWVRIIKWYWYVANMFPTRDK